MAYSQPTASNIRSAKIKAVGGGRKRCKKGKNCSATCIDPREDCLVEMPEPVSVATTKVVAMLQSKKGEKSKSETVINAPLSLADLSKRISQAKDEYEDAYGTPNQAAAKAKFDKAVADYQKAKENAAATPATLTNAAPIAKTTAYSRQALPEYWKERADFGEAGYDRKLEKATTLHTGETSPALQKKMEPYTKLSGNEKAAIQMYGAAGGKEELYGDMNMKLRTGKEVPEEKKQAVDFTTHHLTNALGKLPNKEGEFYRAVSGGGAQALQGLTPGSVITDKGFGSYSDRGGSNISPFIDSKAADRAVMVVQGKRMKDVSPVMPYQEGEHLTAPGTQLKLVKIEEKGYWARKINDYAPTYYFEEI
jgi:hypothetical protein